VTVRLYRNPVKRHGDFADPFVLRHDGRYYLYCTNPDVRCWSSDDLVEWRLEGATIAEDELPGLVPFAPEVVYADGVFWMYTSPSGHGHYVLRAETPTGPFRKATGNVGHAIDGNVFIDDDGRWYFYWAGDEGIWGCEMPSPTEFGEPVLTGINMNGWTEGPFVSKRDGVYFMTLTGNHYLSTGYRIDAASSDHPLHGWAADPWNPILVDTEGSRVGLGHSSSVRGPDLVSTYLVYHDIKPDASRDLDIDRQVWNGRSIQVLGPTDSAPAPAHPDIASRGECRLPVGARFTAEVNLAATASTASYGLSVSAPGVDALSLRVDRSASVVLAEHGGTILGSAALPPGFIHEALHCWRVEADGGRLRLFLDGRRQFTLPVEVAQGSLLEVTGDDVRVGHCAASATTPDAADRDAVVPVPGVFGAVMPADAPLSRRIHVQHPGEYTVYLSTDAGVVSTRVTLDGGSRTLTIAGGTGRSEPARITVAPAASTEPVRLAEASASGWGKQILDPADRDDTTITATVAFTPTAAGGHADLLVRASQLSEGGEGADTRLGTHFLRGYSVQLHADRVVLARHAYDERVLAEHATPIESGRPHALRVRASGARIVVELDGATVIDAVDPLPHHVGRVGIRTADAELHLEDLHLDPNEHVHH